VLIMRFLLALVFAAAGIAKLTDRDGVRRMLTEFGSPASLAAPLGWGLISCELGLAVALAVAPWARVGAFASVVLLSAFGAAVAISVGRGRRPECHCFGRLQSNQVGWSTVARNALLASLAGLVAADGRFPLVFGGVAVVAGGAWLSFRLRELGDLRVGAQAPAVSLTDQEGRAWTLQSLLGDCRGLLLVFTDPACGACRDLMPQVSGWQDRLAHDLTVAIVSSGSTGHGREIAAEFGLTKVLVDADRAAGASYRVHATPSAILIDADRRISSGQAVGEDEIANLVAQATAQAAPPTLQRRAVLARAAMGAAAVTVVPLLSSAAAMARTAKRAVRPKKLKIDGAWLCDHRYALCTSAACKPSKTNPDISICRCRVKTGYAVGFKSCEQRAPKGRQLHSNYSLQDVTSRTRALKCSERGLWVQCLDVVCEVDRHDPEHASCQCANMRTKNFFTFGGNCDRRTCKSVIWSATTAPFPGGAQYEKGLRRLGISYRVPKGCPTPKSKS
jgi:peroxiredoxin